MREDERDVKGLLSNKRFAFFLLRFVIIIMVGIFCI